MPLPSDVDREVATGQYGSVVFAVKSDERMAEAWYWKANLPKQKWKSFESLCKRLVNEGFIINEEQFKHLDDDVFEFKRGGDRLLCFRVGKRWHSYECVEEKRSQEHHGRHKQINHNW